MNEDQKYSYEQRMRYLASLKPEAHDMHLLRIIKGERKVKITDNEHMFYQVNKDRVSLSEFTERDRFKASAEHFKRKKSFLQNGGKSKEGHFKLIGEIPTEIYFSRKELSDPMLPKEERARNIKKWLNEYNAFRTGDKTL